MADNEGNNVNNISDPQKTVGAERRIVALGIASLALYTATWLLERSIYRNGLAAVPSIIDPGHAPDGLLLVWQMLLYVVVTGLIFWMYGEVLSMCRRGNLDTGRARFWALAVPILLNLLCLCWMPRLSQDAMSYLAHGYLAQVPGDNPFVQPVEDVRNTVFGPKLAEFGWDTFPGITPYGIVWTQLEVTIAKFFGGNVIAAVLLFKAVAVAASLGSAWMISLVLGRIHPQIQLLGTLAYLWNPLILMEYAGEGHNDAVMFFFSIAAMAACVLSRPAVSILAQLLAVMTKYVTLLFLPAQLIYLWRIKRGFRHLALEIVIAGAVALTVAAALYAPLWVGAHTFDGMLNRASPISSAALFGGIDWVLRRSPLRSISGPLTIACVSLPLIALVAWSSLRVKDAVGLARTFAWISLAYALVTSPDYWPWYACIPIAWIIVGDFSRLFWLAMLMSVIGRLVAPFEVLHDHGYLSMQIAKGTITGFGSLLPLIVLLAWIWRRRRLGTNAILPSMTDEAVASRATVRE